MSELDLEALEALRKKHGRITHCTYNGTHLVFRKPTSEEAQFYRASPSDTKEERHDQGVAMAQMLLVHPTLAEWHALVDEYPFILSNEKINETVATAMGVLEEKKYLTAPAQPKRQTPSASPAASPSGSPSARGAS